MATYLESSEEQFQEENTKGEKLRDKKKRL